MKAIETKYSGYRFRSRLEARWAVFLDTACPGWEYEKEGYSLKSGYYLPDFWLPRLSSWLEIKGDTPTGRELILCEELGVETDKPVILAWGLPFAAYRQAGYYNTYHAERMRVFCGDIKDSGSAGYSWWEDCFWAIDKDDELCICANWAGDRTFHTPSLLHDFPAMKGVSEIKKPLPEYIADIAKAARFEYEERQFQPATREITPDVERESDEEEADDEIDFGTAVANALDVRCTCRITERCGNGGVRVCSCNGECPCGCEGELVCEGCPDCELREG